MSTVLSHIIQKRFSQVNEDVATDALAYVLESSEAARSGMTKLLRGIHSDLPPLRFKTQQVEGAIRPDMWGFADAKPRVDVEATVTGDRMNGTYDVRSGGACTGDTGTFSASR